MKIYTKTGDDGSTGLFGGGRVPKDHARVEAYGTVDELNSHLGALRARVSGDDIAAWLTRLQRELFDLGADLATPRTARVSGAVKRFALSDAVWIEDAIDQLTAGLPTLKQFILPGGTPAGAEVHVARAVCRRAERAVVRLSHAEEISPAALVYLNRLSDFLFTLAREINRRGGVAEEPWNR